MEAREAGKPNEAIFNVAEISVLWSDLPTANNSKLITESRNFQTKPILTNT
jgi:hypothetical protein